MSEENEIKIKIVDIKSLSELINLVEETFKINFNTTKKDKDVYYDLPNNYYFNLNHGLRIRNENEIAYKALYYVPERKQNPWFVFEKEYELPISKENLLELFTIANINCDIVLKNSISIDELKEILKKLNFIEHIKINKIRQIAKNEQYELCIDLVENLGLFLEIESHDVEIIVAIQKKLPFRYKEIRHGYPNLYAKEIKKINIPDFKEKFLQNPEWNFLKGQKEIIKELLKKS
ncbi:hypothetical protein CMO92_01990 [Candidatus Woesearchaeota archaeon]|nr:hypothetical protein [Candidatus Woesearchaeota archaeon]|tara:strand:- start:41 stop:742 length:702 start_codon:yes stop_codon:yes gene_type:complete